MSASDTSLRQTAAAEELADVSRSATLVGTILAGRYEIVDFIGAGGMGDVYVARDRELDEIVALKVLKHELASRPELVERFLNEVKLARRVTHRAVARTYELGSSAGLRFLTMEFVVGESLSAVLERHGSLPVEACVRVAVDVCDALDAAHAVGVIHRDIKPDNILVTPEGRAVVTDFGVARLTTESATDTSGTPAYMAPEQVRREPPTPATDLYALGVMLFELATGRLPFEGESALAVMAARLDAPAPDPRALVPSLPPAFAAALMRAMAPAAADRFASALDLRHSLEVGAPTSSTPPPALDVTARAYASPSWLTVEVRPIERAPAEAKYLTAALFDEITLRLGRVPRVRVVTGASDVADVVVSSTVVSHGERIVFRALSTETGESLWSARWPLASSRVGAVAEALARSVGLALDVPTPSATTSDYGDAEVLDLCLRARFLYHLPVAPDLDRAVELYRQALERAPDDPAVLSGFSMAYTRSAFFAHGSPRPLAVAKDAAERALAAAPDRPEPNLAAGHLALHTGDPVAAARRFRRALGLAPSWAEAHEWLGRMLLEAGFVSDAIRRLEAAIRIEPGITPVRWEIARAHALDGNWADYERAIDSVRDASGRLRGRFVGRIRFASWRGARAEMEALRRELDVAPEREIFDPPLSRAFVAALIDPTSYATHAETFRRRALVEAQATARRLAFHCQLGAEAAFLAGDDATGYEMLERASEAGLFDLHWLELCPALDPVRGEARFASLAAAVRERAVAVFDALYGG